MDGRRIGKSKIFCMSEKKTIAIIGLGYVGLPLAVEFGKTRKVIGFDINEVRINELINGQDSTLETNEEDLKAALLLTVTSKIDDIKEAKIFIIAVPTPIDKFNRPDLAPLIRSSETVGKVLKTGDLVIYESTVYPGATEDECVPILEKVSGLCFTKDFNVGYSPERINPGDKVNTLRTIKKITSGSSKEAAEEVDQLYNEIVEVGTFKASCIKVAEAAKVVENSQRDINIAFINELAKICHLLKIDTNEVVDAMNTKWNALKFRPGLVGGHCIGVDPYYLTFKAESLGYYPEIILSGRRLNDGMGKYIATEIVKLMIQKGCKVLDSKVLILGITFKENCPDIRNSRVIDIVNELQSFGCKISVYDPWADSDEVKSAYGIDLLHGLNSSFYSDAEYKAIVVAVAHNEFRNFDLSSKNDTVIFDIKGVLDKGLVDGRL